MEFKSFPKPKRIKSKKNLELIKSLRCLVCNSWPTDPDHLVTRGAGGDDKVMNLIPLCRAHHSERHAIGLKTFVAKYKLPIVWENNIPKMKWEWLD